MRILDLFCGAGGAAAGYARAFPNVDIIGIDHRPQPNYPFFFKKADATTYPLVMFGLIHASPPCHDHSNAMTTRGKHGTGWMLAHTVERLADSGSHWVVENVGTAKMPDSPYKLTLCGSMFGLDVRRHRRFALSFPVPQPACRHHEQLPRFPSGNFHANRRGVLSPIVSVSGNVKYAGELELRRKAMQIDWMTGPELAQAIPPAYTAYIAEHFRRTQCVST